MKSLLTSSLLFISIQFNDIVNNQSLVSRAPAGLARLSGTGSGGGGGGGEQWGGVMGVGLLWAESLDSIVTDPAIHVP